MVKHPLSNKEGSSCVLLAIMDTVAKGIVSCQPIWMLRQKGLCPVSLYGCYGKRYCILSAYMDVMVKGIVSGQPIWMLR